MGLFSGWRRKTDKQHIQKLPFTAEFEGIGSETENITAYSMEGVININNNVDKQWRNADSKLEKKHKTDSENVRERGLWVLPESEE